MVYANPKVPANDARSSTSEVSATVKICYNCNHKFCRKFWCSFNSYWRVLGLFFWVFFYLSLGGVIFSLTERPNELKQIEQAQEDRTNAFMNLTDILVSSTNLTTDEAMNLTATILLLGQAASTRIPAEDNPIWDYPSAFFFSSTVITTIGYGTVAPSTSAGRIIFIFYAIIGIPLALLFLAHIGSIIDKFIHALLRPAKKKWGPTVSRTLGVVIIFAVTTIFFILIPAVVFADIETWTYEESVYYAVVSLTTVGFGDFVPSSAAMVSDDRRIQFYKFMSTAWLWTGLAMVSTLITEMQCLMDATGKWCREHSCCVLVKKKIARKMYLGEVHAAKEMK